MEPEPAASGCCWVDDHSIMREGLESMLRGSEEFQVVGQVRDGEVALPTLRPVGGRRSVGLRRCACGPCCYIGRWKWQHSAFSRAPNGH